MVYTPVKICSAVSFKDKYGDEKNVFSEGEIGFIVYATDAKGHDCYCMVPAVDVNSALARAKLLEDQLSVWHSGDPYIFCSNRVALPYSCA